MIHITVCIEESTPCTVIIETIPTFPLAVFVTNLSARITISNSNPPRAESWISTKVQISDFFFRTWSNYRGCRVGVVDLPPVPDLIRLDSAMSAHSVHAQTSRCTCITIHIWMASRCILQSAPTITNRLRKYSPTFWYFVPCLW